jgi:hypothetical protein
MRSKFTYCTLALLFAIIIFLNGVPFIFGDGYGYYHIGKNLVNNNDLLSTNMPEYYPYSGHAVIESDGNYITPYSAGNALLWLPFLAVSNQFDTGSIYDDYYKTFNGHSFADGFAILISASIFAFFSVILIFKTLKNLQFGTNISLVSTASVYLSSFALGYVCEGAAYSHTYELFGISGVLYCITKFSQKFEYKYFLYAGIFSGIAVATRLTNVLVVGFIFLFILMYQKFKASIFFVLGNIPFLIFLLYYNYVSYGDIFTTGYAFTGQDLDLSNFYLKELLFSEIRGWFVYSPIMLIGLCGLFFYARKTLQGLLLYLLPVISTILLYSFWKNWWGGDSLGQRFFISLVPFLTIGIAHLLKITKNLKFEFRIKNIGFKILSLVLLISTLFSLSIWVLHRITPTPILGQEYKPSSYHEVPIAERFSPFDMFRFQIESLRSVGLSKYPATLKENFNGGRSLILLTLGQTTPLAKLESIDDNNFKLHVVPNNVKKSELIDIQIVIKEFDMTTAINLKNVITSQKSTITFTCTTNYPCATNWNDNQTESLDITNISFIKLNENLGAALSSDSDVRFIDYKLKAD